MTLVDFVRESNFIENIHRDPTDAEIGAHEDLLALSEIRVADLENFVNICAGAPLRDKLGMNVIVGNHRPRSGGPEIRQQLAGLLAGVNSGPERASPHEIHKIYETLHPFQDGNGRSGRALWAWHHKQLGNDPFTLGFLHRFYYEALEASQARQASRD